jgi:hypothetical protein
MSNGLRPLQGGRVKSLTKARPSPIATAGDLTDVALPGTTLRTGTLSSPASAPVVFQRHTWNGEEPDHAEKSTPRGADRRGSASRGSPQSAHAKLPGTPMGGKSPKSGPPLAALGSQSMSSLGSAHVRGRRGSTGSFTAASAKVAATVHDEAEAKRDAAELASVQDAPRRAASALEDDPQVGNDVSRKGRDSFSKLTVTAAGRTDDDPKVLLQALNARKATGAHSSAFLALMELTKPRNAARSPLLDKPADSNGGSGVKPGGVKPGGYSFSLATEGALSRRERERLIEEAKARILSEASSFFGRDVACNDLR